MSYLDIGERAVHSGGGDIGTVFKVGRKWVHLRMDRTGKIERVDPDMLDGVVDSPGHSSFALYAWLRHLGHSHEAVRDWYPGYDCPAKGIPYRHLLEAWGLR